MRDTLRHSQCSPCYVVQPKLSWTDASRSDSCAPRVELSCPDLQRRRVLRLVDAKFPAARQCQARDRSPSLLVDRRAPHFLLLHFGDQRLDVVAHQEEFVYVILVGRMHCYLGWWEREDQPAMTCIDRLVLEHVCEECSVSLRIRAVDDDVSTVNHARQYIPFGPRGSTVLVVHSHLFPAAGRYSSGVGVRAVPALFFLAFRPAMD